MSIIWSRHIAPGVLAVYGRELTPRPYDRVTATMNGKELRPIGEPFSVHHCRQVFQLWECATHGELVIKSGNTEHGCDVKTNVDAYIDRKDFPDGFLVQGNGRLFTRSSFTGFTDVAGCKLNGCSDVTFYRCKFYGERPVDATFKSLKNISYYDCDFDANHPQVGGAMRLGGENLAVVNCRFRGCQRPLVIDEYTGPQVGQVIFGNWSDLCTQDDFRNERDGYVYHCHHVDNVKGHVALNFARLDRRTCDSYDKTTRSKYMYAPGYVLANRANGEWARIVDVKSEAGSLFIELDRKMTPTLTADKDMVDLVVGGIRTQCAHLRNVSQGGRFGLSYWGSTIDEFVWDNRFFYCQQPVQCKEDNVHWHDRQSFYRNRSYYSLAEKPVWYTPGGSALPELGAVQGVQEW